MPSSHGEMSNAWLSKLKSGEITEVLEDVSFVEEMKKGTNETLALNALCALSSMLYNRRNLPNEIDVIHFSETDVYKLADQCCIACKNMKKSEKQIDKFTVALYHILYYFLDKGFYSTALLLKDHILIIGHCTDFQCKKENIPVLNNLYLKFWNGSILYARNNKGDLLETRDMALDLRFAAIQILPFIGLNSLPTMSERSILASQSYLSQSKKNFSADKLFNFYNKLLDVMTVMVDHVLKQEMLKEHSSEIYDSEKDWSVLAFKPFSQFLTEILSVYYSFGKGNEGLELMFKYCKKFEAVENPRNHFCGFLKILQDMLSTSIVIFGQKMENNFNRREFYGIFCELYHIQNSSEMSLNKSQLKMKFTDISLLSSSYISATESVCGSLVELVSKQPEFLNAKLSNENVRGILQILKLGAELSMELGKDISLSLKAIALSIGFIQQGLKGCAIKENCNSINNFIINAKEALHFGLQIEAKAPNELTYNWKVALNSFFSSILTLVEVLVKCNCFEACEVFLVEYRTLVWKWLNYQEFSNLKNNVWWLCRCLCMCCSQQNKFRDALSALAAAVRMKECINYNLVFNEWIKVKAKAQLSKKDEQIKHTTIYHVLKENVKDEDWKFTESDICHLLKLEVFAYASKEIPFKDAIQDACNTILEISNDAVIIAEARQSLLELPCLWKNDNESDQVIKNTKKSIEECKKLAVDIKKEIDIRKKDKPEDIPVLLSILARTQFRIYVCQYHIQMTQGQKELDKLFDIPLKAQKDEEGESGEDYGNSSCDVVPAQRSLKSSKQAALLSSSLNIAISLWEIALKKGMKNCNSDNINVAMTLNCIRTAAHIYELYDDLSNSITAWSFLCQYAEIFTNNEEFLLGASNLMKIEIISLGEIFLKKCEDISAKFEEDSPLLFSYWLGLSWQCLYLSELSKGMVYLKKVLIQCNPREGCTCSVLYAQAKHLLAIYSLHLASSKHIAPTELHADPIFISSGPTDSAYSGIGVLLRLLEDWDASGSFATYISAQSLILNISAWLGQLFLDLRLIREAYVCLKEPFLLSQRLLLPNRTVIYLSLLAQADIACQNMNDCIVKLNGMRVILNFEYNKEKIEADTNFVRSFVKLKIDSVITEDNKPITNKRRGVSCKVRYPGRMFPSCKKSLLSNKNFDPCSSPELSRLSDQFIPIPECKDECLCNWCADSGFQKALMGMGLVKVWILFTNCEENILKSNISKCGEKFLMDVMNRHRRLISTSSKKFYNMLCFLETDSNVKSLSENEEPCYSAQILYIRYLLNMTDCYSRFWEETGGENSDIIKELEYYSTSVMQELNSIKCSCNTMYIRAHAALQNMRIIMMRRIDASKQNKNNILDEEAANLPKQTSPTVIEWKTPERREADLQSLDENSRIKSQNNSDDIEESEDPLPHGQIRILPCLNLDSMFKEEQEKERKVKKTVLKAVKEKNSIRSTKVKKSLSEKGNKELKETKKRKGKPNKTDKLSLPSATDNMDRLCLPSPLVAEQINSSIELIPDSPDAKTVCKGSLRRKSWTRLSANFYRKQQKMSFTKSDESDNGAESNEYNKNLLYSNETKKDSNSDHNVEGLISNAVLGAESEKKENLKFTPHSTKKYENKTKRQKPARKDSFIEDSEVPTSIKKIKPKRMPRNPFVL